MVVGFNRSFSLPGSPRPKTRPASHLRSVSLPCRSHPLVSQLDDETRSLSSWHSSQTRSESTSAWICDGLVRLELLHFSLNDLLSLPQNQEPLRRRSGSEWTDRILDDFLRFADVYGNFRSEILSMKEHQANAQIAIRRKDDARLASCIRSMKRTEKQLIKLASSMKEMSKLTTKLASGVEEAELDGIIREAINVTVSASAAVFLGIAGVASVAVATLTNKNSWTSTLTRLRSSLKNNGSGEESEESRRVYATERLEELEECIAAVACRSERLFRCLVNTRVSLLNILSC